MTSRLMHLRLLSVLLLGLVAALPVAGAEILARGTSVTRDPGGITLTIGLSEAVPFRVMTLDKPRRLLIDLGETGMSGLSSELVANVPEVDAMRFGLFELKKARIVLDLAVPMVVQTALAVGLAGQDPAIVVRLAHASAAEFSARSAPPEESVWQAATGAPLIAGEAGLPLIALDPGHGGSDNGAENGDTLEKDIALQFAQTLRDTLLQSNRFRVVLTRETDVFVSLGERVEVARRAGAAAFISLHADAVTLGKARGITVFNLSEAGDDQEAVTIATLENRADLVAGISGVGEDDQLTGVLLQMAYRQTDALSRRFADVVAETLWFQNGEDIKARRMAAGFRVLRAPDIPSILVELGFLSDKDDLENLQNPEWQLATSARLRDALGIWLQTEGRMRGLLRN